ncbi:HindVP family restriction endonuclease [Algoriphagus sp.]|uniref:HindVP family restriction endonuclease n=1 Tax=Algoriphagus sp. TaxID=1872435 RepID=UPI0039198219
MTKSTPGLYGIHKSNRSGIDLWGKNQFNSTFPASLACYMRDKKIKAVYLSLNSNLQVEASEISIDEIFNTKVENQKLSFDFETRFEPYQRFAFDDIKGIDLVISDEFRQLRALEVKLTVLPDSSTCNQNEKNWGSEIVIRPATTSYSALGIADSCEENFGRIREIFEPVCAAIQHWDSRIEIDSKRKEIITGLDTFQSEYRHVQKPFLIQPIWKTKGKSPILDENAFDLFVWSDFAICRPFLDRSLGGEGYVNRYLRSSARLIRILYEISTSRKTNIQRIYTEMAFGLQSDKEFALSGKVTRYYMDHERRTKPILKPDILKDIILNGGEKMLSPERRFDQTIYYTAESLFGEL